MDLIKIIWLDSDRKTRASFERQAGEPEAASKIFAEMIKTLKEEKEGPEGKKSGPNLNKVERGGES